MQGAGGPGPPILTDLASPRSGTLGRAAALASLRLMSQPLTRGPLPASVYWRRRAAAVLVLVTVVSLFSAAVRLVTGGDDEQRGQVALSGAGASSAAPTPTDGAGTVGSEQSEKSLPSGDAAGGSKGRRGKSEPVLPEPQGTCADEDVVVRPDVDGAVAGRPVTVRLTLFTKLAVACTWELSRESFTWKITSGEDEIWTSRECPRATPTRELVVRRDTETTAELTWGGKRSDEDCSRFTEWAMPGYYHVTVAPLSGEPRDVQFELQAPVGAVVTASPDPEPQQRDRGRRGSRR